MQANLVAQLRHYHLFCTLPEDAFELLVGQARLLNFKNEEAIFFQNQAAERFYFVVDGIVKLSRLSQDGQEKVIEIVKPGNAFGEAIMFMDKQFYPVDAYAIEATQVYSFPSRLYKELLETHPSACLKILGWLSMRLHARLNEIETLTLQNATHRVIRYIIQQLPNDAKDGHKINLDIPKRLIASRLSIQPETFSRIMNKLKTQGIIQVHSREIEIVDLAKLIDYDDL
ncbi:MAG: Crp/Fnr family transcriptional regulator [Oceanospirillaceae bacterium]|nr:Crp/Fnr family transcriptional regulator [Oceanospirillaceae bacterium]MCP5349699.1 Crp/Fnr family transcriptional regulator [Oceanospirillaceae bacterium]